MFGPLKERTADAVRRLEEQIAEAESDGNSNTDEVAQAKEVLASAPKDA